MKFQKLFYFFILLAFPLLVYSQTDTVFINEVVISADKPNGISVDGNKVIQIIGREQISNLPVSTLNDLLEFIVSADVRQRGADEVQADISLRGGSAEQTLILLNGIRMNDPQTGHHNLDIPIELSQVERIEIVRGPDARQFGVNAFCGTINIVTDRLSGSNFLKLGATGGMYGLIQGLISGGFSTKRSSNFISFSAKTCDGYTKNTDYDVWKGYFSGSYYAKYGTYQYQAGYSDKAFGANSFYSAKYPDQFEHTKTLITSLQFVSKGKVRFIPQIYARKHHDRFELFRNEAPAWYKNHNYHMTNVLGTALSVQFNDAFGKTGLKAEYFNEMIYSNVLGAFLNDTLNDEMDRNGFFTKSAQRGNISLSAVHQFEWTDLNFTINLSGNYNTKFGYDFCPGIDISYVFKPYVKWYFTANKSFRLPTFTDLYYQGPTNKGNPDLTPEKAYSAETGVNFLYKGLSSHIAGFYRWGKNIIDWVKQPDSAKWESANITELHTWGIETSARISFAEFNKNKCPVKWIDLSYSFLHVEKNSGTYISYYVMDYLRHKFMLGIDLRIYKRLGASITISYSNRNGTYTNFSDGLEKDYKGFSTTDIKLYWHPLNFDIYLDCNNIFDTHYYDFGNIEMSGRWMLGGICYKFDFSKNNKKHGKP